MIACCNQTAPVGHHVADDDKTSNLRIPAEPGAIQKADPSMNFR
jgi:hypothetical protein